MRDSLAAMIEVSRWQREALRKPLALARSLDLLTMLAGCPAGASEHALALHGYDRAELDALAAAGFARGEIRTFARPRGLRVTWFHITEAGRTRLTEHRQ